VSVAGAVRPACSTARVAVSDVIEQVAVGLVDVVEQGCDDPGGWSSVDHLAQSAVQLGDGVQSSTALEHLVGVALGRGQRPGGPLCEACCCPVGRLIQCDLDERDAGLLGQDLQLR